MTSSSVKRKKFEKETPIACVERESSRKKKKVSKAKTPMRKSKQIFKGFVDNPVNEVPQAGTSKINEEILEHDKDKEFGIGSKNVPQDPSQSQEDVVHIRDDISDNDSDHGNFIFQSESEDPQTEQEQPLNHYPHNLDEYFSIVNVKIIELVVDQLVNEGLETLV